MTQDAVNVQDTETFSQDIAIRIAERVPRQSARPGNATNISFGTCE